MKIGFDAKRLFCNATGLGNYSRTLVHNLADAHPEHDYFLYTTKINSSLPVASFLDKKRFTIKQSTALLKAYWRSFGIVRQLEKDGIELYHGLSHELPFGIHKTAIKTVVTIHDLIFKVYPNTYKPIDRWLYDWKFRYSCQHADKIIAISEHTKRDIVHYYGIQPDKIEVLYQACNALYYNNEQKKTNVFEEYSIPESYFIYVGTIQERKNLKLLINAYRHLPDAFKLPLVVVGNGKKYRQEALQLAEKMGLSKRIIWIRNLESNHCLQELYRKAQLLVYPSFYEGFGLPVAEALLSQTPVITANTSSLPEAGGAHTLYVEPTDENAMAAAIVKICSNETFRSTMIEKGVAYANQTFHPQQLSQQLMDCYQTVLKMPKKS